MRLDLSPHIRESGSALHNLRIAHKHRLVALRLPSVLMGLRTHRKDSQQ